MDEVKNKLMQDVSDIELWLRQREIPIGEFLAMVPLSRITWSRWKNGRRTAHADSWQRVVNAHKVLMEKQDA